MKVGVTKDNELLIPLDSLVEEMSEAALNELAKTAVFQERLVSGICELLAEGEAFGDDDRGGWWFSGDTLNQIRLKLLPLLPAITAEAVRWFQAEAVQGRQTADRWRDVAWKLQRAWEDTESVRRRQDPDYIHRNLMTQEQAAEYLRQVEAKISAEDVVAIGGKLYRWGPIPPMERVAEVVAPAPAAPGAEDDIPW